MNRPADSLTVAVQSGCYAKLLRWRSQRNAFLEIKKQSRTAETQPSSKRWVKRWVEKQPIKKALDMQGLKTRNGGR
jgi:hypothetical protein